MDADDVLLPLEGFEVVGHRHQVRFRRQPRITSYNVCYTKLLRGALLRGNSLEKTDVSGKYHAAILGYGAGPVKSKPVGPGRERASRNPAAPGTALPVLGLGIQVEGDRPEEHEALDCLLPVYAHAHVV